MQDIKEAITIKDEFKRLILSNKFSECKACGGKMEYLYSGIYKCGDCKAMKMDDFGKIRTFLDKEGPTPAVIISQETGVPLDIINDYLRHGRLEIPEGSSHYIKCEKCKVDIRFGRYCPECVAQLAGAIKQSFLVEEIGERPKETGKMRYLDKRS